jgi:hypothetical protein
MPLYFFAVFITLFNNFVLLVVGVVAVTVGFAAVIHPVLFLSRELELISEINYS